MAFNGQGQWKQAEWDAFKGWSTSQLGTVGKRLHLLRFKAALTRRRLKRLMLSAPPTVDIHVKAASYALADEPFKKPWEPEKIKDRPLSILPTHDPKSMTGVEAKSVKDTFNRELRGVEYYEHLLQKTRFELQKLEDEIYWLECAGSTVPAHIATVDAQFSDPAFRESLLGKDTLIRHELTDPIDPMISDQFFRGADLIKEHNGPSTPNQPTDIDAESFKQGR